MEYNKDDIIEWQHIPFRVISYDTDTQVGTVECLQNAFGVWDEGDVQENFDFSLGDDVKLIKRADNSLTELEYLQHFYQEVDFGPAHSDVLVQINESIKNETGKEIPNGYGE